MEKEKTFFSESELIALLREKDQKAFSYLYDNYAPIVYGVALRILSSEELAQDVVQEAFLKVWNRIEQYEDSKGRLFTWVINIVRNAAIDKLRSKEYKTAQQKVSLKLKEVNKKYDDSTQQNSEYIGFKEVTMKLKEEHKKIIEMTYFQGYSQTEVAEILGIPLGTVKTRARNALQQLRSWLSENF
ncbi:MAG: sigma-70 family RNA polymerase sigma factor [Thermonemataceae bacterium]|nr:sigma-70 family RNA polymerase sigma factor [Thermonemataceae bacterium]